MAAPGPLLDARDLPPLGVDPPPPRITAARARGVIAFAAVACGLAIARAAPLFPAAGWFAIAGVLLLAAALTVGVRKSPGPARVLALALPAALVCLGAAVQAIRAGPARADALEQLLAAGSEETGVAGQLREPRPARLRGVLLEDPVDSPRAAGEPVMGLAGFIPAIDSRAALMRVESLATESGWARATGRVRLRLEAPPGLPAAPEVKLRAGDRIEVAGRFLPVAPPVNPGQPDARTWARAHGMAGSLTVPDPRLVAVLESFSPGGPAGVTGPPSTFSSGGPGRASGPPVSNFRAGGWFDRLDRAALRWRADLQRRASAVLGPAPEPFTPPRAGRTLLADLLLGIDNPADPRLAQAFTRLGLAHVLAISGFHLVVLAGVSLALIRLTGDRGAVEPAIIAIAVVLYLLIVPASAPVVRSGVMVLALLAAEVLGRRYDRLTVLAWTAVILLLVQPVDLWSLGFQLSYGLTGLLLWLGPRFHAAVFGIHLKGTLDRPRGGLIAGAIEGARRLISTSILCWAIAAPVIAWHTGLFSPLAVLSTLVITPVIIALLWIGFAGLLVGMIWPGLAAVLSPLLLSAGDFTAAVVHGLDSLPGVSIRVPMFSLGLAVAATGVLLYWARFSHRRDAAAWGLTGLVALWGAVELARPMGSAQGLRPGVLVRIDVLEAGGGACAIVRTAERAILWDCGSSRPGFGRYDLPRAARALGVGRIGTAVISHADLSHFSAIIDAADAMGLREVLVTPALLARAAQEPQGPAATAVRLLEARKIAVRALRAGDGVDLARARLEVLSPPAGSEWEGDDQRSLVGAVCAARAGPGGILPYVPGLLLTGQLADDAVDGLVAGGFVPRGPVLYLPARGSARALRELLIESDPVLIIAGGDDPTDFGALWGGDAEVLQTSTDGAVGCELLEDGGVRKIHHRGEEEGE
ncbi:MAG: ComEC/Rec2 family competence protein [Phycisphaerales bacterium]|nr:ComEC/Rec2 family competence protein [Phycisphaerales bacterium]